MESVYFNMLRPLHFVFLFAAFVVLASATPVENEAPANVQSVVEPQPAANDLEADAASYWGYGRPYGGWGYGGRGGYGGWGGRGGYGGWGGRGWGGRGYGGWGGGYWG